MILISFPDGTICSYEDHTLWSVEDDAAAEADTVEDLERARITEPNKVKKLKITQGGKVVWIYGDGQIEGQGRS